MKSNKTLPFGIQVDVNLSPEEQIAKRAHELWQARGSTHGSDLNDWLQAETEINEWHQCRKQSKASQTK